MNWMLSKHNAGYGVRLRDMNESINRLYDALGILRRVPDVPATRRYELDSGKTINLRGNK